MTYMIKLEEEDVEMLEFGTRKKVQEVINKIIELVDRQRTPETNVLKVYKCFCDRPHRIFNARELAEMTLVPQTQVNCILSRLYKDRNIDRVKRGRYRKRR